MNEWIETLISGVNKSEIRGWLYERVDPGTWIDSVRGVNIEKVH